MVETIIIVCPRPVRVELGVFKSKVSHVDLPSEDIVPVQNSLHQFVTRANSGASLILIDRSASPWSQRCAAICGYHLQPKQHRPDPVPNLGKDDVIVPGTAKLALDSEDANRTVVQKMGCAIVKKLTIKISGNEVMSIDDYDVLHCYNGRQSQRGQMVIIGRSIENDKDSIRCRKRRFKRCR